MIRKAFGFFVCVALLATSLSVSGNENQTADQLIDTIIFDNNPFFTNVLVRIDTTEGNTQLPRGVELLGGKPGEYLDIILPQIRLRELSDADIEYSILISDVDSYSDPFRGQYHTLAEMEQMLEDIADNYPDITSLYSIGTTFEGRDIWCLEITDNPGVDEGEPGVFYMGLHHAREWPTVEICLYIADQLTSQYGSDPDITDVVNNRRLWLVTCVNPDGYYYCHDQGHDWRKNRNYFQEFGTYGVDLNRNYAGSSNGDPWGSWGSVGPASCTHNSDYGTYCGPSPLSEFETQAIRNIFLENYISACITWHTSGELVMWPWGYSGDEQTPDDTYMSQVGEEFASRITRQSGYGTYSPTQSAGLYPTTGDTVDWTYGYSHYVQGRTTFAYTIEACLQFQPSESHLDQIVEENFDGALYLLEEAETIKNTVTPRVMPPMIDDMTNDPDGDYIVSWEGQNPDANPDVFQLDELTGLSLLTDDVETGSDLWNLDGFSISDARYHSESHSYKSRYTNEDVSSMTSIYPIPISDDNTLSFWCWYNIENEWDYAFVEVSRDGRIYDILDKFTGLSGGWQYMEYSLGDYVDESVFVRFRSTTDDEVTEEGFYVDDISPVADFETITTLSDSIADDYYEITGKQNGTYYYRVKGYNDEHEWGDFSTLEKMIVGDGGDTEPPVVEITSPKQNYFYFMNREIIPFLTTLIIGDIDVMVDATDSSGVDIVEFFIGDQKMGTDNTAPYNFTWTQNAFFRQTIKVVAIDIFDNDAEDELMVWKFF